MKWLLVSPPNVVGINVFSTIDTTYIGLAYRSVLLADIIGRLEAENGIPFELSKEYGLINHNFNVDWDIVKHEANLRKHEISSGKKRWEIFENYKYKKERV